MTHHVVESTSELSALMKAGVMAGSERDAGFCSGGDEDDMSGLHSPSASEDSVEVQVIPISLRNKRKLAEPRKIQEPSSAPLKKRRFERIEEEAMAPDSEFRTTRSPSPFRPWSSSSKCSDSKVSPPIATETTSTSTTIAPSTTFGSTGNASLTSTATKHRDLGRDVDTESEIPEDFAPRLRESAQVRPSRPERRDCSRPQKFDAATTTSKRNSSLAAASTSPDATLAIAPTSSDPRLQEEPLSLVLRGEEVARVPSHPAVNGSYERTCSVERRTVSSTSSSASSSSSSSMSRHRETHRSHSSGGGSGGGGGGGGGEFSSLNAIATPVPAATNIQSEQHPRQHPVTGQQRNYKNMTRERRIEANARERTRVHTISAAFDTLRRAIPAYSHNQKLSKLSVLRIACSYIMTLGKIVNTPEGEATNSASLGACVDLVSRTIQTEGKLRKRKED